MNSGIPKYILNSKLITDREWEEYQKLKKVFKKLKDNIDGSIDGFITINEYGSCNDILEVLYDLKDILKEVE